MFGSYGTYGVHCIWNNAEGLMGDDASFILCKTMLKVPPNFPDVKIITKTNGRVLISDAAHHKPNFVRGEIQVNFSYKPLEFPSVEAELERDFSEEILPMSIGIPFEVRTEAVNEGKIFSRIKYIKAYPVGLRDILIEAVIFLARYNSPSWSIGSRTIAEGFSRSAVLKLVKGLPAIKEPIVAQVIYNITGSDVNDGVLYLWGWKENYLMYEAEKDMGERVLIYQEAEPFSEEIYSNEEFPASIPSKISCAKLTLELVNKREVLIEGDFSLIMEELSKPTLQKTSNEIGDEIPPLPIEEPIAVVMQDAEVKEEKMVLIEEDAKIEDNSAPIAIFRESKKAKLQKHMRNQGK